MITDLNYIWHTEYGAGSMEYGDTYVLSTPYIRGSYSHYGVIQAPMSNKTQLGSHENVDSKAKEAIAPKTVSHLEEKGGNERVNPPIPPQA